MIENGPESHPAVREPQEVVDAPEATDLEEEPQEPLAGLLETVAVYSEPLAELVERVSDRLLSAKRAQIHYGLHMAWMVVLLVTLIVLVAAGLTYVERIDGATFTFLLGLLVGYVLTFIRDATKPSA